MQKIVNICDLASTEAFDSEEAMEVVDTKFCDWSVPELDLEPSYKKERKSELVNSSLVPVPENDVLMQVDSLVHLESENLDADFHESQCDLESTEGRLFSSV